MPWWKPLDKLDVIHANISKDIETIIGKAVASIRWSWDTMTLLCIVIIILFAMWFWLFGYTLWRRKSKQRRWRRYLRKEREERMSRK